MLIKENKVHHSRKMFSGNLQQSGCGVAVVINTYIVFEIYIVRLLTIIHFGYSLNTLHTIYLIILWWSYLNKVLSFGFFGIIIFLLICQFICANNAFIIFITWYGTLCAKIIIYTLFCTKIIILTLLCLKIII